ncbi:MAG TPA: exodeoxyribonuclease III [Candidatus Fermentibacter daniensis]|jgi:exodeoxyribonuclease-3|nr:MAG: hypothetical protein AO394_04260 [Candidatus Fermentibacter daniensis]MBP7719386.1 exodeoxyribonuclease III [Candidatus Fermentibacter sp.]OQC69300.1 MAG: Exodeoxyribonuclease III [candidate division Hyd24-12 bacterium ADurb.Bin004]KZD18999.1 MAG: hypothetical protein AO395_08530 [Candidatus Fermentibacter daniensis]KZD19971.1 MAG: hypothetical protein AO396_07550 [Candidatus Fermentibacter daniensis]
MELTIASWNVNSIRARLSHVLTWLDDRKPDVLLLQETKVENGLFPREPFEERGMHVLASGQKALNGVAVVSRHHPELLGETLSSGFLADQRRVLRVRIMGITLMDVYVPNGGDTSGERFADKLRFLEELAREAGLSSQERYMLMAGDFNVAPGEDDVTDAKVMDGRLCFHPEERTRFESILRTGLTDLFRAFNPDGKAYSWWDYREGSFRRNAGMRLDHILVSPALAAAARSCTIDREPRSWDRPSDHAPVSAVFELPAME